MYFKIYKSCLISNIYLKNEENLRGSAEYNILAKLSFITFFAFNDERKLNLEIEINKIYQHLYQ